MAQTPEGKVKTFVDDFMRVSFPEAWRYAPPGGAYGRAGVPDRLYLYKGVLIAIEVKANKKSKLTVLQSKCLETMLANGAIAVAIYGKDEDAMRDLAHQVNMRVGGV